VLYRPEHDSHHSSPLDPVSSMNGVRQLIAQLTR
jgi:hypothetical protein